MKIWKEAAKRIANKKGSPYCCNQLDKLILRGQLSHWDKAKFKRYFNPFEYENYYTWWAAAITEKSQLARSLALLFMAEIENDSDNL